MIARGYRPGPGGSLQFLPVFASVALALMALAVGAANFFHPLYLTLYFHYSLWSALFFYLNNHISPLWFSDFSLQKLQTDQ